MKPLFTASVSPTSRLVMCVVLSFICISIDHRHHQLEGLRSALSVAMYPVQVAVSVPLKWVGRGFDHVASRSYLVAQNRNLNHENLMLRARMQQFQALAQENKRLRRLLGSSSDFSEEVMMADVLAVQGHPQSRQVVINRGARQKVFVGQPVLDSQGIVGQVVEVGPLTSTTLLITDPGHALPVRINRSGLRALAQGTDDGATLSLSFVPTNADVEVGDLVVSSGLGGRFPAGYPVGAITAVDVVQGEQFARITVTPSAQVNRARELLLVWRDHDSEPDAQLSEVTGELLP